MSPSSKDEIWIMVCYTHPHPHPTLNYDYSIIQKVTKSADYLIRPFSKAETRCSCYTHTLSSLFSDNA